MTATVLYCDPQDLPLGNVPLPKDADRYISRAAEEIDAAIGFRYLTPVVFSAETAVNRPARLLLKQINSWLAAGRILLATAAPGEDDQLHQYAKYLVDQATMALMSIVDGSVILPGIDPVNPEVPISSGPQIANLDTNSGVEAFAAVFGNPANTVIERSRPPLCGSPYTW